MPAYNISPNDARLCTLDVGGMTMVFDADFAHEELGRRLAVEQADAIRGVLEWLAEHAEHSESMPHSNTAEDRKGVLDDAGRDDD